jgi:hypothetical protein
MLRVVAKHASIWGAMAATPEEFRHKSAVLAEHCAAIGRDPAEIERLAMMFADASNLAEIRARGQRFIDAGATHLVLNIRTPYAADFVCRLSDEVFAPLQAAALGGEKH